MKIFVWATFAAALLAHVAVARSLAQEAPAAKPEANAPAKTEAAPEPGVARQANVNVRGQASINSEVVARLQKGEPVSIFEEITLKKPKQDEPARWFRIALPTNTAVWVHSAFVDAATKQVKPRRLNLRGGPGENYSIVGRIEQGTVVNQIDAKGDWLKIEPPANAFGFVAAHLVERQPAAPAIAAAPAPEAPKAETPAPTPPPVTETVPTTPPPTIAEVTPAPAPAPAPTENVTPPVTATPVVPPPAEIPPAVQPEAPIETVKKVVSREGVLRGSVSIQAPSHFELRSLDTGKTINYVFSPSTNLMLKEFKGTRVIVRGEEVLDERWQSTPVLVVDSLEVVR